MTFSWEGVENPSAGQGMTLTGRTAGELIARAGGSDGSGADPPNPEVEAALDRVRSLIGRQRDGPGGGASPRVGAAAHEVADVGAEAIVDDNELTGVAEFMSGLNRAMNAVAKLHSQVGAGTGFLYADNLVMTNNHVFTGELKLPGKRVATADDAAGCALEFNFQTDGNGNALPTSTYDLRPDLYFFADLSTDVAVCAVDGNPGATWGTVPFASDPVEVGDDVFIIQHPDGLEKQISFAGNVVMYVNDRLVMYTTDTRRGSSGAPVLDRHWRLVALHHAGGELRARADAPGGFGNEGYRINLIQSLLPVPPVFP